MNMRAILLLVYLLSITVFDTSCASECGASLLTRLMDGMTNTLNYMDAHKAEINLDGALGIRVSADQLAAFGNVMSKTDFLCKNQIMLRLQHLMNASEAVANAAEECVKWNQPDDYLAYYGLFKRGVWGIYYPSRRILPKLIRKPESCEKILAGELASNKCFREILSYKTDGNFACYLSPKCLRYLLEKGSKDYHLTHQALVFQAAEGGRCIKDLRKQGAFNTRSLTDLQDEYCANLFRDAEDIGRNNFPKTHKDLFAEQIGVCGAYGYSNFWRQEWADQLLNWQLPSGCYQQLDGHICYDDLSDARVGRQKREEKRLKDGCSSHFSGMALFAYAVSIRFCIENYSSQDQHCILPLPSTNHDSNSIRNVL